ncbi:hypothetical protein DID88_002712 [Monilinia fructigena]|uniref:Uncharacterized protein n=1 Tax=Monilinia fructigena TaxID=38457 RepID=A0A395IQF4_9HELO|nr:hypothetical protein DID88_002712 [Monilinia fructigena]
MPYLARSDALPDLAILGGLEDPRAAAQPSFSQRISCRDATEFVSNTAEVLPLEPEYNRARHKLNSSSKSQVKLDRVTSRSEEIKFPLSREKFSHPFYDLVPGFIVTGGLSRSPAFDCLPVVSHWAERTDESSSTDPAAESYWAARNKLAAAGTEESLAFARIHEVKVPTWCSARKPLPPKLSGVALSADSLTIDVLAREECDGPLLNTSIFSVAVGYNRGVYGGSISGLWAIMDSAWVIDYSIGKDSPELADKLASSFAEVAAAAEMSTSAGPHITDVRLSRAATTHAYARRSSSKILLLSPHARALLYGTTWPGGGEQMAAIAGLGCVVHDWIDLGADLACGEISNIIPTLTGGSLEEEPLAEVYSRFMGAIIWYRDNDPYNPAALSILLTHWWQLSNCRHRPIALLGRTDLDAVSSGISAIIPEVRPSLEHFRACGTKVERSGRPLANAEARLQSILSSNPLPETQAIIELLVSPVLAYVRGADRLPFESDYVGAILAAEIAYPHAQKIMELWDLAIIMWECGAMWAAGVAGLCYTHTGKFNCDRARNDYSEATWA